MPSHFGKPCAVMATRTRFSFKLFLFTILRTLLHRQKTQLFYFQAIPHSLPQNTRGGGCLAAEASDARRRKERSTCLNLLAAKRLYFRAYLLRCFRLSHWWTDGRRQAAISFGLSYCWPTSTIWPGRVILRASRHGERYWRTSGRRFDFTRRMRIPILKLDTFC
jgi:hypothetical protein